MISYFFLYFCIIKEALTPSFIHKPISFFIRASQSISPSIFSEPGNTLRRLEGLCSGKHRYQAQHPGYWKANPLLYADEKDNAYTHPQENPYLWTQGKQVGGKSLTWGGITLRLSGNELKASKQDGYGPDWPIEYSELAPHYSALEKRLRIHGKRDGLTQLPDGEMGK